MGSLLTHQKKEGEVLRRCYNVAATSEISLIKAGPKEAA